MNIAQMMRQAQEMQSKMADLQQKLAGVETTGSAGGGLVQVTLNGKAECKAVKIDKAAIDLNDLSLAEDMIVAAYNDAKAKVERNLSDEMSKITGGINLPPGMKLPF